MRFPALLIGICLVVLSSAHARGEFKAGVAIVDVTPPTLPVLVNGGMLTRTVEEVRSRLHARALALADQRERIAIVVVDSCMMSRPFLDEVKTIASWKTGIAPQRILISATHTHSAPSAMGCLGTDPDARYVPFLRDRIVQAIAAAQASLEPARVGWATCDAPDFTAVRRWVRRTDRMATDPFGNLTVRASMYAATNWVDVTGEAGPEDPELTLLSLQAVNGRPIAVLANFSMHYFGQRGLSADYFGRFCEGLEQRFGRRAGVRGQRFVAILSQGCSGDIHRVDYRIPVEERPQQRIDKFARGLLDIAAPALSAIKYRSDADLAMAERRMTLNYRVPDQQRLEWAKRVVREMGDRAPANTTEVYAREQILLHESRATEVVVQALRIGDIAIATTPTETYALSGLKIKAASPLRNTMVVSLANGGDGYIPPPEQHLLGGYTTWPARTAGLEVAAEPKIVEACIQLLEEVAGKERRPWGLAAGPATRAVLQMRPAAYWRLNEFTGPHAIDSTGHGRDAVFEQGVVFYLEGPRSADFCAGHEVNRSAHFAGGRLRVRMPQVGEAWSVSLWAWNGMPNDGRDVSGWLLSRGPDHALSKGSEHLGVGGRAGNAGRLLFFQGANPASAVAGRRVIPRWEWQHIALVRDGNRARIYLNGELEVEAAVGETPQAGAEQFYFGGRSDNDSNWEGRLDEIAFFDRALTEAEIRQLALTGR
jgi:hypothetical protein